MVPKVSKREAELSVQRLLLVKLVVFVHEPETLISFRTMFNNFDINPITEPDLGFCRHPLAPILYSQIAGGQTELFLLLIFVITAVIILFSLSSYRNQNLDHFLFLSKSPVGWQLVLVLVLVPVSPTCWSELSDCSWFRI